MIINIDTRLLPDGRYSLPLNILSKTDSVSVNGKYYVLHMQENLETHIKTFLQCTTTDYEIATSLLTDGSWGVTFHAIDSHSDESNDEEYFDDDDVPDEDELVDDTKFITPSIAPLIADENLRVGISMHMNGVEVNAAALLNQEIAKYNQLIRTMVTQKRKINELTEKLDEFEYTSKILGSIDRAKLLKMVNMVFCCNGDIVVDTKEITTLEICPYTDSRKVIGRMRFFIPIKMLAGLPCVNNIIIKNLDRVFNYDGESFQCGHVNGDGGPCFGGFTETVIDAVATADVEVVAECLIRFVQSPNFDDAWAKHLQFFPDVEGE